MIRMIRMMMMMMIIYYNDDSDIRYTMVGVAFFFFGVQERLSHETRLSYKIIDLCVFQQVVY